MNQAWSAYIELHSIITPETVLDEMQDLLADHDANLGFTEHGTISVQMSVDAPTARQALDTALKAASKAARNAGASDVILGVELLTEEEQERRLASPVIPELVGLSEVGELLGVSRQRAGQLAEADGFPTAVARLKSGPVFVADQVRTFAARRRGTGRPRSVVLPAL
jgi:hypothetical protein